MATILVVLASTLLLALGGSLSLATATEGLIAAAYRDSVVTLYAADGGAAVVAARAADVGVWPPVGRVEASGRIDRLLGLDDDRWPAVVTVSVADGGATDRLVIVSQARGRGSAQRTVRVVVARAADAAGRPSLRILSWEEVR